MPSRCCRWELLAKKERPALTGLLRPPRRDYAAIVFFANNRFETGKKKLQYLSFGDFAFCAELMIQNWTLGAVGEAPTDPGAWTPPHPVRACYPPKHCLLQAPSSQHPFFFGAPPQPSLLLVPCPHTHLVCRQRATTSLWSGKAFHLPDTLFSLLSYGGAMWVRKAWVIKGGHFVMPLPPQLPSWALLRLPGG